jgi:hypothetical protein
MREVAAGGLEGERWRAMNETRDLFAEKKLEDDLDETFLRLQCADTPTQRRELFERLRMLKAQRSAEKVAELERERGLR